jgi:spermidine synthase
VNDDAMHWLETPKGVFDVVVSDFPDPHSFSLGKLYTTRLYDRVLRVLAPDGAIAIQSTSPLFARRAYWCVVRTVESVGLFARPYHAFVPSFGEWGFVLASRRAFEVPSRAPPGAKHVDARTMATLFTLPPDMGPLDVDVNRLNNQALVRYYEEDWKKWNE